MKEIRSIKLFLTFLFIFTMMWGFALQLNPDKNTNWNYLFNFMYSLIFISGGIINIYYRIKIKIIGNQKNTLDFLGFALISYGIALNIWTYYNFAYAESIPSPAISDIFFAAFYPFAFIATFFFLRLFSFLITKRTIWQMAVISIIVLVLFLGVFIKPEVSKDLPFWINFLNVYYSLMSALILILALTVIKFSGGESTKSAIWLSLGLALHGIGSFFYSIRITNETYWNRDYSDILIAASAYLIAMAGVNIIKNLIPEESKN